MKQVVLSGTDISVSRLAFGTASLHHIFSGKSRHELLASALANGFTHFDTAPYYGFGLAEQTLGQFPISHRSDITIASKVGLYPPGNLTTSQLYTWLRKGIGKVAPSLSRPLRDWTIKKAESSLVHTLRTLRRDRVDILLLHEPDPAILCADEFLDWLVRQREQGKIRAWGLAGPVSLFAPLLHQQHGLTEVLQVRDDLERKEADLVLASGRALQFTYGYLSHAKKALRVLPAASVIRAALDRNSTGSVVVSTTRLERIADMAAATE